MSDEAWCSTCTQIVPIQEHVHFQTDDAHLSTLSARVVEAAVERKRRRDAWMVCREPGDGSSPKYVAYTEAIGELDAAVDALIAARGER